MITIDKKIKLAGMHSDVKPVAIGNAPDPYPNGTSFYEMDKKDTYYYDAEHNTWVTSDVEVVSISIVHVPDTTEYVVGEAFSTEGVRVSAELDNGDVIDATDFCTYTPANGYEFTEDDVGSMNFVASYTLGGVTKTKTATNAITVSEEAEEE